MNAYSAPITRETFAERIQADISERSTFDMADALAQIDAAFPKPTGPAAIFARLIAAGQPVLISTERGAVSFNGEGGR